MIDIYSKYDNMHKNEMFYALICINNNKIICLDCMLSCVVYRFILSFKSLLVLNIHLQPIGFNPSSNSTRSQMSLSCMDFISSFMASIHL